MEHKHEQWSSKIGFILAAAGSAIGLGNIWKFPGKAYEGGGGAFILIYMAIVFLIGLPVMLAELSLGRNTQRNAIGTFRTLNKKWEWAGWIGVIVAFIIACYYSHVGGWVLKYFVSYITEAKEVYADPTGYFYNLLGYNAVEGTTFFPIEAIIYAAIFMAANIFVLLKGVSGGIEKFNKVGMPALLGILAILLIRTVTMDGSGEGLKYMLTCDWSKVTIDTVLIALGQAFYSLSLGMAIMITYGSYLKKEENLFQNSGLICTLDTMVAMLSGFIIVPAVFATIGAENVGKGGAFAFVSLAGVFEAMPGGFVFGALFYLLLLFAALTSCISIIEGVVAYICGEWKTDRKKTLIILGIIMFLIGSLYTMSQAAFDIKGIWFDFKNGVTYPIFGDFMEFLTDRLLIPLCALASAIFVGWVWKPESAIAEIEQNGMFKFPIKKLWTIQIKYVGPIAIALILIVSIVQGSTLS